MPSSRVARNGSLVGRQQPRIASVPDYGTTTGPEAIRLARLAGVDLDPWQQDDLTHGLGEAVDWKCPACTYRADDPVPCPTHPDRDLLHPWAAFEVVEVVARQNGKSEILIARQLAGLFLLEEQLQIYSAHLFDTAMEIFRRLVFLVENCDDLRGEVKQRNGKLVGIKYSHGEEGIELKDGRRIRFKARTGAGGRGFSGDCLYLDEAMILRDQFLGATVPILSARPNPQIWLAGSPPDEEDPSHDGVVLAKRRERAKKGDDPSLAYFERSVDAEGPERVAPETLDSPEQWAVANPGLGIRISVEYVTKERQAMGARQFAVERLGIGKWPDPTGSGRIIKDEMWVPLADPGSKIERGRAFAIDVDPGQAWATLGAAGERNDGLWHVGVVEHARGTAWLPETCEEWGVRDVVVDPRVDLGNLIAELEDRGIKVVRMTSQDYKDACGGFFKAVVEKTLRYQPPQPELDAAVAGARTKSLLDAWKWDRASGALITPLVACTNALWGAMTRTPAFDGPLMEVL